MVYYEYYDTEYCIPDEDSLQNNRQCKLTIRSSYKLLEIGTQESEDGEREFFVIRLTKNAVDREGEPNISFVDIDIDDVDCIAEQERYIRYLLQRNMYRTVYQNKSTHVWVKPGDIPMISTRNHRHCCHSSNMSYYNFNAIADKDILENSRQYQLTATSSFKILETGVHASSKNFVVRILRNVVYENGHSYVLYVNMSKHEFDQITREAGLISYLLQNQMNKTVFQSANVHVWTQSPTKNDPTPAMLCIRGSDERAYDRFTGDLDDDDSSYYSDSESTDSTEQDTDDYYYDNYYYDNYYDYFSDDYSSDDDYYY
ncbi:hypothetical protein TSAR_001357 [Trichomalopsis sarcophagae]|uniref:Uncharacterized protein n=1 Tax=Trichomalopsis sarcophagae TaxID=543379 RepID=A0A232ETP9_9HYME|nr:hypothetical protein TSAR_001357 [Trichomalopsis sarcophagae]